MSRMHARFCLWLLSALLVGSPGADEDPFESGLIERTGVDRMFLDVVVGDKNGQPIPGLTVDDFRLRLNDEKYSIESVDELRNCKDESPRYILYFDFSQMRSDGRAVSQRTAERWIREVLEPDDEVKLAAYATLPGLRELTGYTTDRGRLLATVQEVFADPTFLDTFPELFPDRYGQCRGADQICERVAREEWLHGRRGLEALATYIGRQEGDAGRKALLLFHQTATTFPDRVFGIGRPLDHLELVNRIGSEATLTRTTLFTAYSGEFAVGAPPVTDAQVYENFRRPGATLNPAFVGRQQRWAVNLGATLADFSGGSSNLDITTLDRLIDDAGRGCPCIYRLAIKPPTDYKNRVYRAKVIVGGRKLPFRYRLRFLDERDRWWREAEWVLLNPDAADDLAVSTGIIPSPEGEAGWNLRVQVGVDAGDLVFVPKSGGRQAEWEVAALLTRDDKNWKMLARSRWEVAEEDGPMDLLHQRVISGVKPGTYRLRAFVRDRIASASGGSEFELILPEPGADGFAGPIAVRGAPRAMILPLPQLTEKALVEYSTGTESSDAEIVIRAPVAAVANSLEFKSWVCAPRKRRAGALEIVRYVTASGRPLFQFDEPARRLAECVEIVDRVDTASLPGGEYRYNVRRSVDGSAEQVEQSVPFQVTDRSAGPGSGEADQRK